MRRRRRFLSRFVYTIVSHPKRALFLTVLLTVVSIFLAGKGLHISSDQNKLFSPKIPFFNDFLTFNEQFPENEALYVIIQPRDRATHPPVDRWTAAADAIGQRVDSLHAFVDSVSVRVPPEEMGLQGTLFEPPQQLRNDVEETRKLIFQLQLQGQFAQLAGGTPIQRLLQSMKLAGANRQTSPFAREVATSLTRTIAQAAKNDAQPILPDFVAMGASDPSRLGYFYLPDASDPSRYLMLVKILPHEDYTSLTAASETVEAIRSAVREAAGGFPEFDIGLTGRPALEADEMRTTDDDSTKSEIVALSAVFIGVAILLRSIWLTIAAELALGVGIAWTFAWATLTLGELNLLSIVFMLALIGIGMDYLIQILSRYRREAARKKDARRIWLSVFHQVGPPINTATLGAAGAFLVSLFTGFKGAADLGLIAGGGLLLCLLSGYTFLPALLTLFPTRRAEAFATANAETSARQRVSLSSNGIERRRRLGGPVMWLILLLAGLPFALRTQFDPGLLNLQAPHLRSVQLVRKLETWSAVVLSRDVSALRAARSALAGAKTVDYTESILDASDNYQYLTQQITALPRLNWPTAAPSAAGIAALAEQADALADAWATGGAHPGSQPAASRSSAWSSETAAAATALRKLAETLRSAPPPVASACVAAWQSGFVNEVNEIAAAFDPPPPDYTALPPALRSHLVSESGLFALYIYPKEDLWNQAALNRFINEIEPRIQSANDPGAPVILTGIAHNIFHTTTIIRRSFVYSTLLALGLIFILVLIDLRSIKHTLAAVSVLALGLPMLVAIMGLLRIDWNFANFFGLPILIGAGHEYGVFLVHRYREAAGISRRAWGRWDVADAALLLCAFVTSSSFGFFYLFAHHRGLKSLGWVMAVGTACIYLASVVVVRPLLKAALRRRRESSK